MTRHCQGVPPVGARGRAGDSLGSLMMPRVAARTLSRDRRARVDPKRVCPRVDSERTANLLAGFFPDAPISAHAAKVALGDGNDRHVAAAADGSRSKFHGGRAPASRVTFESPTGEIARVTVDPAGRLVRLSTDAMRNGNTTRNRASTVDDDPAESLATLIKLYLIASQRCTSAVPSPLTTADLARIRRMTILCCLFRRRRSQSTGPGSERSRPSWSGRRRSALNDA